MNFAFYDYTSSGRLGRLAFRPIQRVARRLLRPMFDRLRDLIQLLYDMQLTTTTHLTGLGDRVAVLEAVVAKQSTDFRAFLLDYKAAIRRFAELEDRVLSADKQLAEASRLQVAHEKADERLRSVETDYQSLTLDHQAAVRRLAELEDRVLAASDLAPSDRTTVPLRKAS